jgi:hypothetical protein
MAALAAALAKVAGGLLALALVRPWGRVVRRRWLLIGSAGASVLLTVYGGLNVLIAALVLSGAIHPDGSVDRTALRWHAGVWDLWFLVWGILLALATLSYRRRTATGHPRDGAAKPSPQLTKSRLTAKLLLCRDEARHPKREPELDVLRAVHGSSRRLWAARNRRSARPRYE